MRRGRFVPSHQEPLEDRVDKAGIKQCCDPAEAKRSRAEGRVRVAEDEGYDADPSDLDDAGLSYDD